MLIIMELLKILDYRVKHLLENRLPVCCFYHSLEHTLDVADTALKIAEHEQLPPEQLPVLKMAALLHDTGFVRSSTFHEINSCFVAYDVLQPYALSQENMDAICSAILATRIPQRPTNLLEKILCDADLDYLGRDDFYVIGERLFQELKCNKVLRNRKQWNTLQVSFLKQHHYFTQYSNTYREPQKQRYLFELEQWLLNHA